jgi:endonuclease-3
MARRESKQRRKERLSHILDRLETTYPNAKVGLDFTSPFELLIATILSAQCTDERVNTVTPALFAKYRGPSDYVNASQEELEHDIHSTGFFRNKAKNIRACCQRLLADFGGSVPTTLEALVTLPGVGRKTANCVLSNCFNIPGVTVDTHVTRIMNLLQMVDTTDAVKIEFELMELVQQERWNAMNHLIITHGRQTCVARRPACQRCAIAVLCPSAV